MSFRFITAARLGVLALSLLPACQLVEAQYPQRYDAPRYDTRQPSAVDRALNDLRNVAARNTYNHREHERYEHALEHLSQFANKLYSGRFDRGKLDRSIDDMQDILRRNPMDPRAREALSYDLGELERMRSNSGYAYRY